MISSNMKIEETPAFLYARAIALIQEYMQCRADNWNSTSQTVIKRVTSFFPLGGNSANNSTTDNTGKIKTRNAHCHEQIEKIASIAFSKSDASQQLITTIHKMTDLAKEMQASQVNSIGNGIISLSSPNSLCAIMFHAVRVVLVRILRKTYPIIYQDEINDLKKKLKELDETMIRDFYKFDISSTQKKYIKIYHKLLNLQDADIIQHASIYKRFPEYLPSIEIKNENIETTINIPFAVYYDNFDMVYIKLELFKKPDRHERYEEFLNNEIKKLSNNIMEPMSEPLKANQDGQPNKKNISEDSQAKSNTIEQNKTNTSEESQAKGNIPEEVDDYNDNNEENSQEGYQTTQTNGYRY